MKQSVAFLLSLLLGMLLWLLSSTLTGKTEPWDVNLYYIPALIIVGVLAGLIAGNRFWLWPIGVLLGELIAIIILQYSADSIGVNFFFPIGFLFLTAYSVFAFIGSALGVKLKKNI